MSLFVSQLFNGLQTGSVYALVALGYSMVYGIILLLNFAHGDIIMIGAYTAFYAMTAFHLHPIFSVVLAVITSTLLGVVIEKVAYTPLRSAPRLSLLITAIGISFLLENGAQLLFGADTKSMDTLVPGQRHLWTGHGQLYRNFNDYRRSHRDGCPDAACPEDEARQGNACGLRGYGRGAADGHQPEQNHFLHLCSRFGACRYWLGSVSVRLLAGVAHDGLDAGPEGRSSRQFSAASAQFPAPWSAALPSVFLRRLLRRSVLSVWKDAVVFAILIVVLLVKPSGIMGHPVTEKV